MPPTRLDADALYGTWRLVASQAVDASGAPIRDPWGPAPMGVLILSRTGRMMAMLCDGRDQLARGETRSYSSYTGPFRLEGDVLITTIDAASDPRRIGSEQPRTVSIDGDRLVLCPPARPDGERRTIHWVRVAQELDQ